jgi:MFS superfamily sulfate permease-like transporter
VMNESFRVLAPGFELSDPEHLVRLPVPANILGFFQQFTFPDLQAFRNQEVYIVGATIAIVASLESLLSLEAAHKLDPFKRISPSNRELIAQGTGNMISGMLGGLPITAVVVRTSANIYAGARTRMSALVHGVLLLAMAMLFPKLLNLTPLACLASILLVIGYKLAKVELFQQMWKAGHAQFLPFVVTVLAIVFTDLLKGVIIGFAFGLFFVIRANHHHAITVISQDNYYLVRFNKDVTFVNKSEVKEALRSIPANTTVILDGTKALYIDRDIREVVDEFRQSCYFRGIKLEFKNFGVSGNAAPEALVSTSH